MWELLAVCTSGFVCRFSSSLSVASVHRWSGRNPCSDTKNHKSINESFTDSSQPSVSLTCPLRFQVAVDRRRRGFYLGSTRSIHWIPSKRRGDGSYRGQRGVPKAHVGGRGNLPPQGSLLAQAGGWVRGKASRQRGHWDVVGIAGVRVHRGRRWRNSEAKQGEMRDTTLKLASDTISGNSVKH